MRTLPYKFLIVLPEVGGRYKWHRFYKTKAKVEHAKFADLASGNTATYRIDLEYAFFKQDDAHWRGSELRQHIQELFARAQVTRLNPGSTIVMVWTNAELWFDNDVMKIMEVWDGNPKEPESVWGRALACLPSSPGPKGRT